jgi:pteridine reductase
MSVTVNSNQPKIALVTGGAKRVGAAICRILHAQGANVIIHFKSSEDQAAALRDELNNIRPNSTDIAQADLLDIAQMPTLVETVILRFGRLDILVNNASTYYPTEIGQITNDNWNDLMGSNLKGPAFLTQAAANELRQHQGCIVNITDMHIYQPKKSYVVYSVAKAGLVTLTKSLAQELSPEVRVNAVAPGPVMWPESNLEFDEIYRQSVIQQTLLKRIGDPSDIAKAVKFLVYDAPFITGHVIAVDGGRSINL